MRVWCIEHAFLETTASKNFRLTQKLLTLAVAILIIQAEREAGLQQKAILGWTPDGRAVIRTGLS
jgi:hypothetical protein